MALAVSTACSQKQGEPTPTFPPLVTATATAISPTATIAPSPQPATKSPAPTPGAAPTVTAVPETTATPPESRAAEAPGGDDSPLNPDPIPTQVVATGSVNRIAIAGNDGTVYTVNPDGTDKRRVSPEIAAPDDSVFAGSFTWPVWSPDGGSILFSAIRPSLPAAQISLMRAPADGDGQGVTLFVGPP